MSYASVKAELDAKIQQNATKDISGTDLNEVLTSFLDDFYGHINNDQNPHSIASIDGLRHLGVVDGLAVDHVVSTDGETLDLLQGNVFNVLVDGDLTLDYSNAPIDTLLPSNKVAGTFIFVLTNDVIGGHVVSFAPTKFKGASGLDFNISNVADEKSVVYCFYNGEDMIVSLFSKIESI